MWFDGFFQRALYISNKVRMCVSTHVIFSVGCFQSGNHSVVMSMSVQNISGVQWEINRWYREFNVICFLVSSFQQRCTAFVVFKSGPFGFGELIGGSPAVISCEWSPPAQMHPSVGKDLFPKVVSHNRRVILFLGVVWSISPCFFFWCSVVNAEAMFLF